MTAVKPKAGDRVQYVYADPYEFGTILEVSPSGDHIQVKWDKPDEYDQDVMTHTLRSGSGVKLVRP